MEFHLGYTTKTLVGCCWPVEVQTTGPSRALGDMPRGNAIPPAARCCSTQVWPPTGTPIVMGALEGGLLRAALTGPDMGGCVGAHPGSRPCRRPCTSRACPSSRLHTVKTGHGVSTRPHPAHGERPSPLVPARARSRFCDHPTQPSQRTWHGRRQKAGSPAVRAMMGIRGHSGEACPGAPPAVAVATLFPSRVFHCCSVPRRPPGALSPLLSLEEASDAASSARQRASTSRMRVVAVYLQQATRQPLTRTARETRARSWDRHACAH